MPNLNLLPVSFWPGWGVDPNLAAPQVYLRTRPQGEGGDDTAPVVTLISPPDASLIAAATPLVIEVTDATVLRRVLLTVRFPLLAIREVVYEEGGFAEAYASSFVELISNGFRFTVIRNVGWPQGGLMLFKVYAIDLEGNEP